MVDGVFYAERFLFIRPVKPPEDVDGLCHVIQKGRCPKSCFYGLSIMSADVILADKQLIRPELGKMAFFYELRYS
jgi:hypothetical protein